MDHSNHTTLLQAGGQTAISDRMRELLARAAQDHVYEQRTQGAVLDEIRQRLEGMEWLLREVRERELGGLSGTLETVSGRLDDIAAKPPMWAEGLAQHVEAVRDHVDAVGEQVGAVDSRVESVHERVAPGPGAARACGPISASWRERRRGAQAGCSRCWRCTDGITKRMGDFARQAGPAQRRHGGRRRPVHPASTSRWPSSTARTDRVEGAVLDLSDGLDERLAATAEQLTASTDRVSVKVGRRRAAPDQPPGRHRAVPRHPARRHRAAPHRPRARPLRPRRQQGGQDRRPAGRDRLPPGERRPPLRNRRQSLTDIGTRLASVDDRFQTADESLADIGTRLASVDHRSQSADHPPEIGTVWAWTRGWTGSTPA